MKLTSSSAWSIAERIRLRAWADREARRLVRGERIEQDWLDRMGESMRVAFVGALARHHLEIETTDRGALVIECTLFGADCTCHRRAS
jgi:hypothetical protein